MAAIGEKVPPSRAVRQWNAVPQPDFPVCWFEFSNRKSAIENCNLKDGRGGEIRTRYGIFGETIENTVTPIESMVSMRFRVFVKMQRNAVKSFSDDRKR